MSLIRNLDVHQAPSFAPFEQVNVLSTADIRHRVIRAIKTSRNWTKPGAIRVRTLATIKLSPRDHPDEIGFYSRMKPEVVAGGKYVIAENQGQIEVFSVCDSKRLWSGPEPGEPVYCHSFGSEIQEGGSALIVAAAYVNYSTGKRYENNHTSLFL